jgi:hypothetical protein
MLSRQECVTASDPVTMATAESADTGNVVHEVTVKLDDGKSPEAWAGLKPPGQVPNGFPCTALALLVTLPAPQGCVLVHRLGPASLGPATAEYEDGLCRYRHFRPDMFCQPGSRYNANCSRYCMHLVLACWLCCAATLSLHRTAPHPPAVSFRSAHSMRCTTCCKRRLCCLPT